MSAFLIANMAPIMFASLVVVLLLGYPAAFSLGAVGLIYALVGIGLGRGGRRASRLFSLCPGVGYCGQRLVCGGLLHHSRRQSC